MRSRDGSWTPKQFAQTLAIEGMLQQLRDWRAGEDYSESEHGSGERHSFARAVDIQLARLIDAMVRKLEGPVAGGETEEDYARERQKGGE